jgi:hypothetical protein
LFDKRREIQHSDFALYVFLDGIPRVGYVDISRIRQRTVEGVRQQLDGDVGILVAKLFHHHLELFCIGIVVGVGKRDRHRFRRRCEPIASGEGEEQ